MMKYAVLAIFLTVFSQCLASNNFTCYSCTTAEKTKGLADLCPEDFDKATDKVKEVCKGEINQCFKFVGSVGEADSITRGCVAARDACPTTLYLPPYEETICEICDEDICNLAVNVENSIVVLAISAAFAALQYARS